MTTIIATFTDEFTGASVARQMTMLSEFFMAKPERQMAMLQDWADTRGNDQHASLLTAESWVRI